MWSVTFIFSGALAILRPIIILKDLDNEFDDP